MSIIPITFGTGYTDVNGSLSTNALQASAPARVVGVATNETDSSTQTGSHSSSTSFTTGAGINAIACAFSCIPDTVSSLTPTLTAKFIRTSDSAEFDLNLEFLSSPVWDKTDPGVAIFCATGIPASTAGTIDITADLEGENIRSYALSAVSIEDVASFGNSVTETPDVRSSISLTTAGGSDGALFLSAFVFQGGGTDWVDTVGWTEHINTGTDVADQFNDLTILFQSLPRTTSGNVTFQADVNSAFAASEPCSGLVITAQGQGPS